MSLNRRTGSRFTANIWPGFVDAMTALLLVLMFVLTVFLFLQFFLQETITGQRSEIDELSFELSALAEALGLERQRSDGLERELGVLNATLADANDTVAAQSALIAGLRADNADALSRIASFEDQVASLLARNADIDRALTAARAESAERSEALTASQTEIARLEDALSTEISSAEALRLALAQARSEIDAQAETARLAAAQRETLEALIADLQAEIATKEVSLADLAADLRASENREDAVSQRLADVEDDLSEAEAGRLAELGAAEALRALLAEADPEVDIAELTGRAAAEAIRRRLAESDAELTAMTLALEDARQEAEDTLELLAAAEAARRSLELARAEDLTEMDRQRALLAAADIALAEQRAETTEARRRMALLNQQSAALSRQLAELQGLLDEAEARDAENQIQIEALGTRLNTALAQVAADERRRAAELEAEARDLRNYRSEFFGQMRALLGQREGIEIVGDRFVFSSEVLFASGSATLSAQGQQELARVAAVLLEVAETIPEEIAWILRVDGHTDAIPIGDNSPFTSNWQLSQARALSVVQFLISSEGMPPQRLAATGFGEFQPIANGFSAEALARNRRIELKLTER